MPNNDSSEPSENEPLIEQPVSNDLKNDSLPKVQFALLCALRILDPMTFCQIFPYINQLITDLNIINDPSQVGFYSGLVESVFAVTQLFSVLTWSFLSDEIGRRPTILAGGLGIAIGTLLFGFSTTFPTIIGSRALIGLFAGNAGIIPTAIGDISNESNRNFVYPTLGIFWPVGMIVGPLIGGHLSNPAAKFKIFQDVQFFIDYPYILPCFVVAGITLIIWLLALFFLKESLPHRPTLNVSQTTSYGTTPIPNHAVRSRKGFVSRTISLLHKTLVSQPKTLVRAGKQIFRDNLMVRAVCISGLFQGFLTVAFDAVFVLFCYSPIAVGGLGFPPEKIGTAIAVSGLVSAILQATIMPSILGRYGVERVYWCCTMSWPIAFFFLPFLSFIARWGIQPQNNTDISGYTSPNVVLWLGIGVVLLFVRIGNAAGILNSQIIANYLEERQGTGNGLLQMCNSLSRILGPGVASSLFVTSKQHNILGGNMWVVALCITAIAGGMAGRAVVRQSKTR